jgi:Thiamin pyrophosphokinase, vitamin B1 binding domain
MPHLNLLKGDNFVTEFGGLVSTSNELVGETAIVATDKSVLWTIELRRRSETVAKESKEDFPIEHWKYNLKVVSQPDA